MGEEDIVGDVGLSGVTEQGKQLSVVLKASIDQRLCLAAQQPRRGEGRHTMRAILSYR
jgi:hypothetical protein